MQFDENIEGARNQIYSIHIFTICLHIFLKVSEVSGTTTICSFFPLQNLFSNKDPGDEQI